jgi:hypothetical protein
MKTQLSKKFYAELAGTAKKIVKYEKGQKVAGYKTVIRSAPVSEKEVKAVRKMGGLYSVGSKLSSSLGPTSLT